VTPEVGLVVASLALLETGVLPVSGGLLDQSATWQHAVNVAGRERNATRKRMAEQKE